MKFTFIKAKQALGSVVYYKKETIVEYKGGQAGSLARGQLKKHCGQVRRV